jgi:uncharacterized protein (TIGR00369 family)
VPVLDVPALQQFLADAFPADPPPYVVEAIEDGVVRVRLPVSEVHGRPGGTVSGPTLMALADATAYLGVVGHVGPVALAVTTSLHIDFLRKPPLRDVVAEGTLLKLGRRLAVVDVALRSEAELDLVAKAQVTYSIPPGGAAGGPPTPPASGASPGARR